MRITFRLNTARDGDLIKWLQGQPDDPGMSFAIRQVLRQHLRSGFFSRDTVGRQQTVTVTPAAGAAAQPEPAPELGPGPAPPAKSEAVDEKQLEQALAAWAGE